VLGGASGASAVANPKAAGVNCTVSGVGPGVAATVAGVSLSPDQMHNAQVIVAVVNARKLDREAAQIALMTGDGRKARSPSSITATPRDRTRAGSSSNGVVGTAGRAARPAGSTGSSSTGW